MKNGGFWKKPAATTRRITTSKIGNPITTSIISHPNPNIIRNLRCVKIIVRWKISFWNRQSAHWDMRHLAYMKIHDLSQLDQMELIDSQNNPEEVIVTGFGSQV